MAAQSEHTTQAQASGASVTKGELRAQILAKRNAIDPALRNEKSLRICSELVDAFDQHTVGKPATVALFHSMKTEVDLTPFIEAATTRNWRLCFPVVVKDETAHAGVEKNSATTDKAGAPTRHYPLPMEFFQVDTQAALADATPFLAHPMKRFSSEELVEQGFARVAPKEIDALVAPLVGFDDEGNRLGYGGGCYDAFLPRLRPDALVVAVAFEEQRVAHVPTEPHDLKLSHIICA